MTFIEDMRTRLLVPKRTFGNIRKSVGVISDEIGCNLDDGTCGLARATSCNSAADKRQTTWTNDLPFERVRRFELKNLRELFADQALKAAGNARDIWAERSVIATIAGRRSVRLSLSETQSCWQLISNRAMLLPYARGL
jgi:hypothetical protein